MKKIILIFAILIYSSCTDAGKGKIHNFTLKNESNKTIKILGYVKNKPNTNPTITILEINGEITKTYQNNLPPNHYDFGNFLGSPEKSVDSIKIIFDNSKVLFYYESNCDSDRNLLNFCEYQETEETFIFTIEDYENAEDCNGDCE